MDDGMLDTNSNNDLRGTICIEDIEIGMTRSLRKIITDRDIELFAEISTDHNPVHLDDDYARDTIFEGRIAHGMLTAGLISAVIGEQLPGHGTVYLGRSLRHRDRHGHQQTQSDHGNLLRNRRQKSAKGGGGRPRSVA